jgi:hypothetical protein
MLLVPFSAQAQFQFTNRIDLLGDKPCYSGVAIGAWDMDGDGLDDVVRMYNGFDMSIHYQQAANKPFRELSVGSMGIESQWGLCTGDIDNNGFSDVLVGGAYDFIKVVTANQDGSAYSIQNITDPETFVQAVNFVDINNDGWLDAFVCHDDGPSRIFMNDGTGQLSYDPSIIDLSTVPASDDSGNYGSVWSDVDNNGYPDLYIAKCRQGVNSPSDPRRINQLFLNNGDGTYTQDINNDSGLRIGAQSWTADFGDIDNDGDFDCFITNHDVSSQLLENDGSGHFTDITFQTGLLDMVQGLPIQGIFRDMDNDGFLDILVAGTTHYMFKNNGNHTFTQVQGLFDANQIESYGVGDLNNDGFWDIYAGYALAFTDPSTIPDALWMNNGNANHYFGLSLRGVQSNRSAIGAKAVLYNKNGMQVREVRGGESYGIANSGRMLFGLGNATEIDSVLVYWPSGVVDKILQPSIDQYAALTEGSCYVEAIQIGFTGDPVFCSGDSVVLNAPTGFVDYDWNTGDSTLAIVAKTGGLYRVSATDSLGCVALSVPVFLITDPDETPNILVLGDTLVCKGTVVQLRSSPANAYLWSNGDTTETIEVDQPGAYTVTIQGVCASFTSSPVLVYVLDAPAPATQGDTVGLNGTALLTAQGNQIVWYSAETGGVVVGNGGALILENLQQDTTLWAQNINVFDQANAFVGAVEHQGTEVSGNQFNGNLIFDCYQPVRLQHVKVYASVAAERKIDLLDAQGNTLQSKTVNIPVGESIVQLDFDLPVGTDLQLTTDENVNQSSLGTISPQLRRSDEGVQFPYDLPGVISIKNSVFGLERYYYFYNWEIDYPGLACESIRVPATAVVDSNLISTRPAAAVLPLTVYPNPAQSSLYVSPGQAGTYEAVLYHSTGAVKWVRGFSLQDKGAVWETPVADLPDGAYWLLLTDLKSRQQYRSIVIK